ncbi:MAG: hypothetical protein M9887_01675 [Chitinophagales bacterium]|nr:hypothetical protein [Chitinophagales bacterium]
MDIKEALVKIEQYWQIIRNLHFHIEQEGKISQEEYALIDKYLKVISQKYKSLIDEFPEVKSESQELAMIGTVNGVKDKINLGTLETEKAEQDVKVEDVKNDTPNDVVTISEETIVEVVEEENTTSPTQIQVEPEIKMVAKKRRSIATYLEEMLSSPGNVPETPLLFPNEVVQPKTSLNEKLQQTRKPIEDLNTRIKKSMSERISLNNKFEFIRELFDNQPLDYETAIRYLDSNDENAWQRVENEFAGKFNWEDKTELVEKLKSLIS